MNAPSHHHRTDADTAQRKHRRVGLAVAFTAVAMLGISYAAVPLYDLFCRTTGFAGTPIAAKSAPTSKGQRILSVRFDANVSPELDWSFAPEINSIQARTGETKTVFYKVANRSKETVTAMAVFNVSPGQSGGYFNKISCFCFTDVTLGPGESMDLPVVFYLDPALESDNTMKLIEGITLSYTFSPKKEKKAAAAGAPDAKKAL